jgi:hypothetical protein
MLKDSRACPKCHSKDTIPTSTHFDIRSFMCLLCEHVWTIEGDGPQTPPEPPHTPD